ncbi:anti-sigma factor [Tenacibaculum sp. IB213877]|uniref:anti-sigma factor n=1 Tax=Tenacibaculum sp. IB213877 TaxID=3097351 RepID=UPI002A5AFF5F|nr:anti-sigma factor [Tenacibaculum sp. IB213877]MDY0779779.1 anti-sigma factor [Tenacibaculum sp. IB213877]
MDKKKYIESGILELYIAGALSEKENKQVHDIIIEHPEILDEVKEIEKVISTLTASLAPSKNESQFKDVLVKILQQKEDASKVLPLYPKKSLLYYSGWAASILLGSTLIFYTIKTKSLNNKLNIANSEKVLFQKQLDSSLINLNTQEKLLAVLRNPDLISVPLKGQGKFDNTFAKIYWDKSNNNVYLDAQGLPIPPKGKVYQLWSLKLNPLTPTSLGTIDNFSANTTKIFTIKNVNESQAFGITLEPEGGSLTPTLDQLYTLGTISS